MLFSLCSQQACQREQVDLSCRSLDSTSYSLTGRYDQQTEEELEEQPIEIKHGYSKDHRPDLKQVVQEMIVSQDGGIPLLSKSWDGNASDNTIFKERTEALIEAFQETETLQVLVADSKLYHKDNADFMKQLRFITLVPSTVKLEQTYIDQSFANTGSGWTVIDSNYQYQAYSVEHMGIAQRWLVVHSQQAKERAEKSVVGLVDKAEVTLQKALFHLQAERFACQADAEKALHQLEKKLKFHSLSNISYVEHKQYEGVGRPKKTAKVKAKLWQVTAKYQRDEAMILHKIKQKSCFVLATNTTEQEVDNEELLTRYKAQSKVESGFRFLKDPIFFVASFFIKKPSRIDALLMIMTLSLLVYSIAQRRLRANMAKAKATIPNQIRQATATPTLRWVFQCFEGIHLIYSTSSKDNLSGKLDNLNEIRLCVIRHLAGRVAYYYKIQENGMGG